MEKTIAISCGAGFAFLHIYIYICICIEIPASFLLCSFPCIRLLLWPTHSLISIKLWVIHSLAHIRFQYTIAGITRRRLTIAIIRIMVATIISMATSIIWLALFQCQRNENLLCTCNISLDSR